MKKILIADDSMFMRGMLKEIVAKAFPDYEVMEAEAQSDALAKSKEVDLVLLDIIMPEAEEGVEVLRQIKKDNPDAKVIMITAVGSNLVIEKCREIGCLDYITKPFDEAKIIETLKKYI